MLGTFVFSVALIVVPQGTQARPPECALEVLTPQALEERALAEFNAKVERYVRLHRRLVRSLPPDQVFADEEDMGEASEMLADAIRAARPHAAAGDIFSVAASELIRRRISLAQVDGPIVPTPWTGIVGPFSELIERLKRPVVNDRYVWATDTELPAALVSALPPLPRELAYKVAGSDLVLLDVYANLVVDVLENAFEQAS